MKIDFLILFLFLSIFGCHSQNDKATKSKTEMDLSFINNEKIKHSIVLRSCDTCVPISNIGDRVTVFLSKKEKDIVRKVTFDTWKTLLNDSKSDWAANLILYSIYDKDAILLSVDDNDNMEVWRKYYKKQDLDYWKLHLK